MRRRDAMVNKGLTTHIRYDNAEEGRFAAVFPALSKKRR